ncbi:hypothetical protein [Terracoccus sp. 273MFTsu3.1]|uniref:hypothetical protein n=1 Tax=Terracoccus sp. 273MFTsu3.1 TaxID=1172188 RepID=UPI00037520F3|nr:hypothetical protein [Terracoccus sp. 273MFTsu3.1]
MNLTDLRDELTTHADDLGTAPDFTTAVAGRVRTTKRRRAVAAGSVATLAVAALAVGVVTSLGRPEPTVPAGSAASAAPMIGADGMPFRSVPDAPGDVVKDGLRYRARVGDDTLVAGFVGDRGQGQFSLVWEPTTTHVSVGAECYLPGLTQTEAAAYMVTVSLTGTTGFFGSSCSAGRPAERDLPAGGTVPGEPGRGWSELTVGKATTLRVQLVDAKTHKPTSVDGAQLTGAVYEQGTLQPVEDEAGTTVAALPTVVEHQGYRYRVAGVAIGPLASGTLPELGVPTSVYAGVAVPDGPFLVSWGSAGKDLTDAARSGDGAGLRLEGLEATESRGYGSWGEVPVRAGSTRSLRLVAEGPRPDHGTAFIVIYTPEP